MPLLNHIIRNNENNINNHFFFAGKAIPLGPNVEQVFPKNHYTGLDYNEYIIFNPEQVKLRYLVHFI